MAYQSTAICGAYDIIRNMNGYWICDDITELLLVFGITLKL